PYRWQRPRALPPCYRYGTRANPGRFTGGTGVCPQPAESEKELHDEDCLQVNVWIPIGDAPKDGWPVLFYIHGGFLQWGSPNGLSPSLFLSSTSIRCIIVAPGYRLNALGFLATPTLASPDSPSPGNYGFWDQRLALQWTHQNISLFGGNASNVTVAGYSAGSHSTFYQLAYDLYLPDPKKRVIKRVMMLSNGPGLQPKTLDEHRTQFLQLTKELGISETVPEDQKLEKLRKLPAETIVDAAGRIRIHEFRAVSDGEFVRKDLFRDINNGTFAAKVKQAGVKMIIGECRDEHFAYAIWRPPSNTREGVYERLRADYPEEACKRLMNLYSPKGGLPNGVESWTDLFGRIYADVQIYCLERGFVDKLVKAGCIPGVDVLRYRMEWRIKNCWAPPEWGVTHATDMAIWFCGNGDVLEKGEGDVIIKWLHPVKTFLEGGDIDWGTSDIQDVRRLNNGGQVDLWRDDRWEEGLETWDLLTKEKPMANL
ncbi:MAG: hypothetical protein M1820_010850, partial [Bogoriella megaspora]